MNAYRPQAITMTGATGQLGCALLRHFAVEHPDLQLRLLVRRDSPSFRNPQFQELLTSFRGSVQLVFGDLRNLRLSRSERALLAGSDGGVWHFAANLNLRPDNPTIAQETEAVNLEGTRQVLELCGERGDGRLFYISTAFIAGIQAGVAYEDRLAPGSSFRNSYERSKAQAEQLVQGAMARGVTATIFRPSLVIEDRERASPRSLPRIFAAAIRAVCREGSGIIPLPVSETVSINMVPGSFVTQAMVHLAACRNCGKTYHLTARRSTTFKDIGVVLNRLYPSIRFVHNHPSSSFLGRMLDELKGYWTNGLHFDRSNLEEDLTESLVDEVDWPEIIDRELGPLPA